MSDISVVIPALNEEKYLPGLLQSLAEQTCTDFEVVVVDGASQDKTVPGARSFGARLAALQVIVSPQRGVSRQRNLGAQAARGQWLVFVDADSRVSPHFIERIEQFIHDRQPEFFTIWTLPDGDTPRDAILALIVNLYIEGSIVAQRAIAPGAMIGVRHDLFDRLGGFDKSITFSEDFDLTQRLIAHGAPLDVLRETLYVYSLRRVRKDGLLHFLLFYSRATLLALFTRRAPHQAPSYVLGGQYFETR
jgi:glycosyltransferase involved in cell wall biosynthesis